MVVFLDRLFLAPQPGLVVPGIGVDLPKEKRVEIGLTYVYGIGRKSANDILAKALTMVINFVTEYLYDRFVVFGKSIDTNKRAQAKGNDE